MASTRLSHGKSAGRDRVEMLPVIQFLGFTIPIGPLFAVLAFVLGSELGARALGRAAPPNQRPQWRDAFGTGSFLALAAGLVGCAAGLRTSVSSALSSGARHVAVDSSRHAGAHSRSLSLRCVILMLYLRRKGVPLASIADAAAIGVAGGLIVWHVGQFLTGADYGTPTALPWGVELWGTSRHPVQIYAAVLQVADPVSSLALPGDCTARRNLLAGGCLARDSKRCCWMHFAPMCRRGWEASALDR